MTRPNKHQYKLDSLLEIVVLPVVTDCTCVSQKKIAKYAEYFCMFFRGNIFLPSLNRSIERKTEEAHRIKTIMRLMKLLEKENDIHG